MALVAANVVVGVTGEVNFAVSGTPPPTTAAIAIAAPFVGLGYNTDSGITESIADSSTPLKAWQNSDTVRLLRTDHVVTYKFDLLQTDGNSLKTYYGNYAAGKVELRADTNTRGVWVIDVKDGSKVVRLVIPDGEVTERGDVTWVGNSGVSYPITIFCYPVNGVKATQYHGALA